MAADTPTSVVFDTTVASAGNNTGIVVTPEAIERLAAGGRPAVLVDLDGYAYRTTVAVMDGRSMISVSAAVRAATGLRGGDPVRVTLTLATTPRDVDMPADFAAALAADDVAGGFFGTLSNSLQRFHVDSVDAARSAQTRQRRIERAVSLFRDGKQR